MRSFAEALQRFFGGFGLPAYGRNNVPDAADAPYISYEIACPPPLGEASLRAWVWYPGNDYQALLHKIDALLDAMDGGAVLDFEGGRAVLVSEGVSEIGGVDGGRAAEMRLRAERG